MTPNKKVNSSHVPRQPSRIYSIPRKRHNILLCANFVTELYVFCVDTKKQSEPQRRNVIGSERRGRARWIICNSLSLPQSLSVFVPCSLCSRSEQCNYKTVLMSNQAAPGRIHKGSASDCAPLRANISSWSRRNATRDSLTCSAQKSLALCDAHFTHDGDDDEATAPTSDRTHIRYRRHPDATKLIAPHWSCFINHSWGEFPCRSSKLLGRLCKKRQICSF